MNENVYAFCLELEEENGRKNKNPATFLSKLGSTSN
jgi:hypothetical protein